MADAKDIRAAMEASSVVLTAVEEQIIQQTLSRTEKRIAELTQNDNGKKEVREPYEFS